METIMQETIREEEIISWMAGFFDAEGCFRINKSIRKNNYITYSPRIMLNNTDLDTMDYLISLLLKKYGINCYVRNNRPTTNRNIIRYIEISRITKVTELCDLLLPHAIVKYDEIKLLKDFCVSRSSRFMASGLKNKKLSYNDYERNLYDKLIEYKAHKKGRKCLLFNPIYSELPNNVTWSWFAGYTDGDGSFSINKRGSASYCVATSNPTADKKLNNFFVNNEILFYHDSYLPSRNHLSICKRRIFRYFVNDTSDILKIISNTKKYLITKFEIACLMEKYCNLRLHRKGKWRTIYEKEFVNKMSKLTQ